MNSFQAIRQTIRMIANHDFLIQICRNAWHDQQKFFLLVVLLFAQHNFAQTDSVAFAKAITKSVQIQKGIVLKQMLFAEKNLFASNQHISIVEITPARKTKFAIGYEAIKLKTTSEFGKESNALVAINGNFFDTKNGGSVDYLKVNGQVVNVNATTAGFRNFHQKAAIAIQKGRLSIMPYNHFTDWESRLSANEIMVTGPLLLFDSKPMLLDRSAFYANRHPRSVVATTAKGKILLITVDGRHANAAGMSLLEIQKILKWLKAQNAINLDGGGSSTLWVAGFPNNGVVNYPCDTKQWDHTGERKVANVILVTSEAHLRKRL